ncbi:MAG: TetR/AcrR family transcriptional regulator [Usitatibacteraceae bacterium]
MFISRLMETERISQRRSNKLFGDNELPYPSATMELKRRAKFRSNDPQGVRGRILDAAAELFQARGYHDTSVQDVKVSAAVSSGAFHHHFESKKALGVAVIKERVSDVMRVAWLDPLLSAPSVAHGVYAAVSMMSNELRLQGFVRGCPVNNLALELAFSDSDFRYALQSIFDEWRAALAQRLAAECNPTILEGISAEQLATFIVAAYSGAMTMSKAEQSPEPLETIVAVLMQVLKPQL